MRFRHKDAAPVLAYLEHESCDIRILEWDRERRPGGITGMLQLQAAKPAGPAMPGKVADVAFIAGPGGGPDHAGTVLRFYFHINCSAVGRPLPLVEAVEHVEGQGIAGEFLLAGHPDGGLISVARERLPFQQNLDPISWWGP